MFDLNEDIIGTDPKYIPIADHNWLHPQTYDNYPSDNNPVRIQPKLAELWGNDEPTGINLVPNLTVQPLGQKSAGEIDGSEVVREAKKAMMMGLKGRALTAHIRARFASELIEAAKKDLQKLSEEQGLLGNVYIDASAFSSANDAERFMIQHRTRLARDIIINESKLSPEVVSFLASKFHKNVVASIDYNEKLFKKYKAHLIDLGKIGRDYVIDSKESLRKAFLATPMQSEPVKAKDNKKLSQEEISEGFIKKAEEEYITERLADEELLFREVRPIIIYAREQRSKGKVGKNLKEVLMNKYLTADIKKAAKYLAIVVPSEDMSGEVDKLVTAKRIPRKIGLDLKKILKDNPVKAQLFEKTEAPKQVGMKATLFPLTGHREPDNMSEHRKTAVEMLKKGSTLEKVKGSLMKNLSSKEADKVLANAINDFNLSGVGAKANVYVKPEKKKVVADLPEKQTLPDPDTIPAQISEYTDFFAGSQMGDIDIDSPVKNESIDIGGLSSTIGLDEIL